METESRFFVFHVSPKALKTTTKTSKYLSIHKINIKHPTQSFKDNPYNYSLCYSDQTFCSQRICFCIRSKYKKRKTNSYVNPDTYYVKITLLATKRSVGLCALENDTTPQPLEGSKGKHGCFFPPSINTRHGIQPASGCLPFLPRKTTTTTHQGEVRIIQLPLHFDHNSQEFCWPLWDITLLKSKMSGPS